MLANTTRYIIFICALVVASELAFAEWQMAESKLTTIWAEQVDPANPLPEYPRPQLTREAWLNLNGVWQYAKANDFSKPPFGKSLKERILVPFPVESALSGIKRWDTHMWYRRLFKVPSAWAKNTKDQRIHLHFGAVDFEAQVYVNGKFAGMHRGGFDAFSFDISDLLRRGDNELLVGVIDTTDRSTAIGKQNREPKRHSYTPASGIWQTVWLEPTPKNYIDRLELLPDLKASALHVAIETRGGQANGFTAIAYDGNKEVGRASGYLGNRVSIPIANPKLWDTQDPFLYTLKVRITKDGKLLDEVGSYFGMRSIEVKKVGDVFRPLLNGKFIFQTGTLDQGYWPNGVYTAPTDAALKFDIQKHIDMGFNMVRKHIKVEPQRWYYWADKLGLLVWQDLPNKWQRSFQSDMQFEHELVEMIREHYNSPAIIQWVIFNEAWGIYDRDRVVNLARKMDPYRIITGQTGGEDKRGFIDTGAGDVRDHHTYGANPARQVPVPNETPNGNRMSVIGEYGGIEAVVQGHSFGPSSKKSVPLDQVTDTYIGMQEMFRPFIAKGLSAVVYTQITDLETEQNGLLSYDRRVQKVDADRIRKINLSLIAEGDKENRKLPRQ